MLCTFMVLYYDVQLCRSVPYSACVIVVGCGENMTPSKKDTIQRKIRGPTPPVFLTKFSLFPSATLTIAYQNYRPSSYVSLM